jgi:hypothetical protein
LDLSINIAFPAIFAGQCKVSKDDLALVRAADNAYEPTLASSSFVATLTILIAEHKSSGRVIKN